MNRKNILIFTISVFLILGLIFSLTVSKKESFEDRRERVLNELSFAIEDAMSEGKYECCIEPPCTMCYLGNWVWDDGTCDCDGMILKGDYDNVCPQCKKGIEEGECKSDKDTCLV